MIRSDQRLEYITKLCLLILETSLEASNVAHSYILEVEVDGRLVPRPPWSNAKRSQRQPCQELSTRTVTLVFLYVPKKSILLRSDLDNALPQSLALARYDFPSFN